MSDYKRRDVLRTGALLCVAGLAPTGVGAFTGSASRVPHFVWKLCRPESAGMSRVGLEGVRAAIQKNIDAKTIAGAVSAVTRHNKLVWFEAQGWADVEAGRPMRRDSLFRMMSSSKVITSVAVLMMIEEGRLALEDPVGKFIPSFRNETVRTAPAGAGASQPAFVPAVRDITIGDLLTHTSGFESIEGPDMGLANARRGPNDTLASAIPGLGSTPLDFQPGTKWRYTPLYGMDTLLYLVELVSGIPADRFLKERIFQPLDMRSTFFNVPEDQKGRLVKIYAVKDGKFEPRPWLFGDGPFRYFSGAGGLISCAHDMLNFELMLLNRGTFNGHRLLKPDTVALMSHNHVGKLFAEWIPAITGGNGFGLGVRVLEDERKGEGRAVGAFGWGGAYGTETWADPRLDMAVVMLIQMDSPLPNARVDFTQALRRAIVA